jgi:predicted RNA binding protein YcfA (HicA-like mRNA interferase family)
MNIAIEVRRFRWIQPKSFMPSARADAFRRAAMKLGFRRARQDGSHERWIHADGRATTIPIHPSREIGGSLFYRIIKQLGVTQQEFERLR